MRRTRDRLIKLQTALNECLQDDEAMLLVSRKLRKAPDVLKDMEVIVKEAIYGAIPDFTK